MRLEGEQVLLRVYLRNTDTDASGWQSAAGAIVERAQSAGLAGATILRGRFGLDSAGNPLESRLWSLVEHVPVIVEIVDGASNIGGFLATVAELMPEGMMSLERAHVLIYRQTAAGVARAQMRFETPPAIEDLSTLPSPEEFPLMKLAEDGQMLRIFIGESDRWNGEPLARAIVNKARELGLAGATVLHGAMGFGASSRVHTDRLLALSTDLPVLIEIVDSRPRIESLLPFLDEAVQEGLITIESVRVLKYRHENGSLVSG